MRALYCLGLGLGMSLGLSHASVWAMDLAIIIDDLGYKRQLGLRTLDLPVPLTVAILPATPHADYLAQQAIERQQEVMPHLPMENQSGFPLGAYGLYADMSPEEQLATATAAMASLPMAKGFNNHQGSLLTASSAAMANLFNGLPNDRWYFVDSITVGNSQAWQQARDAGWSWAKRDIFLDHERTAAFIEAQLELTWQRLQRQGHAIVIGHPYEETLAALEAIIPSWQAQGVHFVSMSEYLQRHPAALPRPAPMPEPDLEPAKPWLQPGYPRLLEF